MTCSLAGAEGEPVEIFAERFGGTQHQVSDELEQVLDPFDGRLGQGAGEFAGVMCAVHVCGSL